MALSGLTYVSFVALAGRVGADALSAIYLAWAIPAFVLLARTAFTGARPDAERSPAQPMISATAARTSPGAI